MNYMHEILLTDSTVRFEYGLMGRYMMMLTVARGYLVIALTFLLSVFFINGRDAMIREL